MLSTDTIVSPPHSRARLIASLFIGAYLLWQVALPLAYYLGDDLFDERFAWRMFSSTFHYKRNCKITVYEWVRHADGTEGPLELDLTRAIHQVWVARLGRSPAPVVDKFLRTRCEANPRAIEVEFGRYCPAAAAYETAQGGAIVSCGTGFVRGMQTLLSDEKMTVR
jgi:hypothetical protein